MKEHIQRYIRKNDMIYRLRHLREWHGEPWDKFYKKLPKEIRMKILQLKITTKIPQ